MFFKCSLLLASIASTSLAYAQPNSIDTNHFFDGQEKCGLLQLEGLTSNGNACLVNVKFGKSGHPTNEGSAPCIPTATPLGGLNDC